MERVPEITIEALLDRYEVLLFDAYGVLVHNTGALPGAVELCHFLNSSAKPYYIVTNDASKLPGNAARLYREYGMSIPSKRIITSGVLLKNHFATQELIGSRCAVLGPIDSVRYVEDAGGRIVSCNEAFEVLVIADESGFPFFETIDTILSRLFRAIDRQQNIHLVLLNPDIIYPKSGQDFGFGAGGVATMFEAALETRYPGRRDLGFIRLGKPHGALFTEALRRSGTRDMVMVGDQLGTDILGARRFGIDAVWVPNGATTGATVELASDLKPSYCLPTLKPSRATFQPRQKKDSWESLKPKPNTQP